MTLRQNDKNIFSTKNGYTLVELMVVVAITLLIAVFGIPSISKYSNMSQFRQKNEEVKQIFNQIFALAANPKNTNIKYYKFYYSNVSDPKYYIKSCVVDDVTGVETCPETISSVILAKNETGWTDTANTDDWMLQCNTAVSGGKISCVGNIGISSSVNLVNNLTTVKDSNLNVSQKMNITITNSTYSLSSITSALP